MINWIRAVKIFFAKIISIEAPSSSIRIKDLLVISPGVVILLKDEISDSNPLFPLYIDLRDSTNIILSINGTSAN